MYKVNPEVIRDREKSLWGSIFSGAHPKTGEGGVANKTRYKVQGNHDEDRYLVQT